MRILVLGGTSFLGRTAVEAALQRDWSVTTFTRSSELPDTEPIHGDRADPTAIARLAKAGPWDAVIDTSGQVPRIVQDSARALAGAAQHYVFISTVSVYKDWPNQGVDEASPIHDGSPDTDGPGEPSDPVEYGQFKRGCELAVTTEFGADRSLVLRPTVLLGPYEIVGRLPWWLNRMARSGRVLCPNSPARGIQPLDVRDLANFMLDAGPGRVTGTMNAAAPIGHTTMGGFLGACSDVTMRVRERPLTQVWADGQWLIEQGVGQWRELPLWREHPGVWAVDASRAHAAGLVCRPISKTVRSTWDWLSSGVTLNHRRAKGHGISPDREAEVLAAWDALPLAERPAHHSW